MTDDQPMTLEEFGGFFSDIERKQEERKSRMVREGTLLYRFMHSFDDSDENTLVAVYDTCYLTSSFAQPDFLIAHQDISSYNEYSTSIDNPVDVYKFYREHDEWTIEWIDIRSEEVVSKLI